MNVNTYCLLTDTTLAMIPMTAAFFVLPKNVASDSTGLIMKRAPAFLCLERTIQYHL